MDPVAFVLSALPPPPARVLEVGCGAGELAFAIDAAGYDVVAVDPRAPAGPIFRQTTLARARRRQARSRSPSPATRCITSTTSTMRPTGSRRCCGRAGSSSSRSSAGTASTARPRRGSASSRACQRSRRAPPGTPSRRACTATTTCARALDRASTSARSRWQPFLHRPLERPELEPRERAAIERGEIQALGFRWVGTSALSS